MPAYAHYRLDAFCRADPPAVLGALTAAYAADAYTTQRTDATTAWNSQTEYLQTAARQLIERLPASADWHLLLEYQIPRRARRIDAVLLAADVVLVLEFKTGESPLTAADRRQVEDYALDLRDFHTASCGRIILPLLVAPQQHFEPTTPESVLGEPVQRVHLLGNSSPADFLLSVYSRHHRETETPIDPGAWNGSEYRPVPTIIEAAQRLYADHRVRDIAHSHAGADNLTRTADAVLRVIDEARRTNTKAVCFITGVPGAGKTLAGLNIVHSAELHQDRDALGVFLSGNGPLVKVLTEALARDRAERKEEPLGEARRQVKTFIQNVHQFLAAHSRPESPLPPDHVVVFDEAQRAWDLEQARRKFKRTESEPTQMLRTLDRLPDWAVLVALVGGGQEIHRGEAGLPEWGRALQTTFGSWKVYVAPTLAEGEEGPGGAVLFPDGSGALAVHRDDALHLSLGRRSYKAEVVANWVDALLTGNAETARNYAPQLSRFPLALTRSLDRAWGVAPGSETGHAPGRVGGEFGGAAVAPARAGRDDRFGRTRLVPPARGGRALITLSRTGGDRVRGAGAGTGLGWGLLGRRLPPHSRGVGVSSLQGHEMAACEGCYHPALHAEQVPRPAHPCPGRHGDLDSGGVTRRRNPFASLVRRDSEIPLCVRRRND